MGILWAYRGGALKKQGSQNQQQISVTRSIDLRELFLKKNQDLTEICMHGRLAGCRTSLLAVLRMLLQLTVTAHFS